LLEIQPFSSALSFLFAITIIFTDAAVFCAVSAAISFQHKDVKDPLNA
jgi:hypothetical protein